MAISSTPAAGRAEVKETWPFFVLVSLVIVAGYVSALRSVESLKSPLLLVPFTVLMLLIGVLYWLSPILISTERRRLIFFLVQVSATFVIGLLTPHHWLFMGLYPSLIGVAIGAYWPNIRSIAAMAVLILGLMAVNLTLGWGFDAVRPMLPSMGLGLVFVFVYVILFVRQVDARQRAQDLLDDLNAAHDKLREYADQVEQLTLTEERERMGRELHDTLAQGLAGLIMQLEAIEHHLDGADNERAKSVLKQAMDRARSTLHEARRAIQALRASPLEDSNLAEAITREADRFSVANGIPCECHAHAVDLPPGQAQDLFRIVQECLCNVARHAEATRAALMLEAKDGAIRLVVEDDGGGFDPGEKHSGFGLPGMHERAARLSGTLEVDSHAGRGTRVELKIPGGKQ